MVAYGKCKCGLTPSGPNASSPQPEESIYQLCTIPVSTAAVSVHLSLESPLTFSSLATDFQDGSISSGLIYHSYYVYHKINCTLKGFLLCLYTFKVYCVKMCSFPISMEELTFRCSSHPHFAH